jgi:hypothetical protein
MQPAEDRAGADRAGTGLRCRLGRLQAQAPMRTVGVVVGHELPEHGPQVPLVEDDQVVQTLPSQGAHDSFRDGVRPGRPHGREQGLDARSAGPRHEVSPVDGVPIPQQVARLVTPGCRLDELPPHPGGGRARRDVDVDQLAPAVGDEQEP